MGKSSLAERLARVPWPILILIVGMGYLTVFPIGVLLWGSLRDVPPGVAGNYTLDHYVKALTTGFLYTSAFNSVVFALGAAILSTVIGGFFAWVVERTNVPMRWLLWSLIMFPLLEPGILKAISWLLLFSPRAGAVNRLIENWLGIKEFFNIYSMWGMIWAQATGHITLPFLLMSATLRSMDPSLEEASSASGGGVFYTLRKITLPLMLPGFLATFLLLFMTAIESFEVPAIIGLPARIPVFAAQIWMEAGMADNFNLAATYSMAYLLIAGISLWIYYRATGFAEKYSTITGKNFRPSRINLNSKLRWLIFAVALLILGIMVILPLLILIYASLLPNYMPPSPKAFASFTLSNYTFIFGMSTMLQALKNTVIVGVSAGLVCMFLAALISWITLRTTLPGRKLLDFVAFAPIGIPGMVMGMALVWTYVTIPLPIYGTLFIVILGFTAKYIPYGMRTLHATMMQVHKELEEASTVAGASFRQTFFRIILPLIMPGMVSGFIYIVVLAFKVLSLPVFLVGFNTQLLSTFIYQLAYNGEFTTLAAVGVLMMTILIVLSGISSFVGGRFGVKEMSSGG